MRCSISGKFLPTDTRFNYVEGDIKSYGIYKITNQVNGKYYIGSCFGNNFKTRWQKHLQQLKKEYHPNKHLQYSFNKHGEDNFTFEILESLVRDKSLILSQEQKYLDTIVKDIKSYNFSTKAEGGASSRLSEKDCLDIVNYFLKDEIDSRQQVADKFNICVATVSKILTKKNYNSRNIDENLIEKCKLKGIKNVRTASSKHNISQRKLSNFQAYEMYCLSNYSGVTRNQLSKLYNVNPSTVGDIIKKRTYKNIHKLF